MGELPAVRVQDLDFWEPVLGATLALQMDGIQKYILAKFKNHRAGVAPKPVRILALATRSEMALRSSLKMNCIRALVYRHRPISPAEGVALGVKLVTQITHIRERVRTFIYSHSQSLQEEIGRHIPCSTPSICQRRIYQAIVNKLEADLTSISEEDTSDIFQAGILNDNSSYLCTCGSRGDVLARSLASRRWKLDVEIQRCAEALGLLTAVQ